MQDNYFDPKFLKSRKIKIHAEKVAKIDQHKTRRTNLKETTFSSKELISRASHLASSIDVANKIFSRMKLPYLDDVNIAFYSPEKIILATDKQILKSKVKELEPQFISILREQKIFSKLKKIEVSINYEKKEDIKTQKPNKIAIENINKLKEEFKR